MEYFQHFDEKSKEIQLCIMDKQNQGNLVENSRTIITSIKNTINIYQLQKSVMYTYTNASQNVNSTCTNKCS